MNWTDLATSSNKARSPQEAPAASVKYLPMDLTAAEALAEWDAHWLRCTDPGHTGGEALHLSAYRERFERLARQEETGVVALPVPLPAPPRVERPSENALLYRLGRALIPREGRRMSTRQKMKLSRVFEQREKAARA